MTGAVKATGERGSWFATVGSERLPCVHRHWVTGTRHADPGYVPDEPKWIELLSAIRAGGRVVLTKDRPVDAPGKKSGFVFEREGYIAIFDVANVVADDDGLRFDLVRRVQEIR